MFHSNTELLIDYWRARRGAAALPARAQIHPADFPALVPQVFIVGVGERGAWPIRLAGEFLADVHGLRLRGGDLIGLWAPNHREALRKGLAAALSASRFLVVRAEADAGDGEVCALEILFAPLSGPSGVADRFLGLYQPIGRPPRVGVRLGKLRMRDISGGAATPASGGLRLAAMDGRRLG
jgi:hypothetical protein